MRLLVCLTLLFICLATLPSIHCQNRKFKLSEYSEKDRRDTNARYSKRDLERDDDNQRYKKLKYRGRNDDEEETNENRFKKKELRHQDDDNERQYSKHVRKYKKEEANDEEQREKRYNKNDEEEMVRTSNRRNRVDARKLQDSDEDNDSEVCINRKGQNCETTDDDSDETEEKVPVKKFHVKKFAHEKQKSKQDREMGNIIKLHKKDARRSVEEDDDSSEEAPARKRGRFIWADEDE